MNTPQQSIGQTLDELARQAAEGAAAEEGATPAEGGDSTVPDGQTAGGGEGEATPTPAGPAVIDDPGLPPELRGRTAQEIGEIWGLMRQAMSAAAASRHEQEVTPLAPPTPAAPSAEPTPDEAESLRELIQTDPQRALDYMLQKNYGGMIRNLAASAQEGLYARFRGQYDDFKDHEPQVRKIISSLNLPPEGVTPDHISAAYYMARGTASVPAKSRAEAERAAALTEAPTPPAPTKPTASMDDTEREIARRTGMTDEEFISWRDKGEAPMVMSVPDKVKGYGKVEPPTEKKD